jgi:type IV secretory pathway VirB4 component
MAPFIQTTTQQHLDIEEIKDDIVILKNGGVAAVMETTAVNFDLLSEIEQDAIIAAFSMLLNSISFPVQVVIRSKKIDISKYIEKVQRVEQQITDPLLKIQAESYRKFVQEIIRRNDVLDKKFYVVIMSGGSALREVGSSPFEFFGKLFGVHQKRVSVNINKAIKQGKTDLSPKVEHMINEFNRIGVKSRMLTTQDLVELYFDIYNPSSIHGQRIRTNIKDYQTAIVEPAILEE